MLVYTYVVGVPFQRKRITFIINKQPQCTRHVVVLLVFYVYILNIIFFFFYITVKHCVTVPFLILHDSKMQIVKNTKKNKVYIQVNT